MEILIFVLKYSTGVPLTIKHEHHRRGATHANKHRMRETTHEIPERMHTWERSTRWIKVHKHLAANIINHCQWMSYSLTSGHRTYHQHTVKNTSGGCILTPPSFLRLHLANYRLFRNGRRLSDLHNLSHPALTRGMAVPLPQVPEHRGNGALISQPDIKVIYSHCFAVWHSHVNTHRQVKERNLCATLTWPWSHRPPAWHYQSPTWCGHSPAFSFSPEQETAKVLLKSGTQG